MIPDLRRFLSDLMALLNARFYKADEDTHC